MLANLGEMAVKFLPTPSARRATRGRRTRRHAVYYFYPRPPRGGRRFKRDFANITTIFLPTPSARRATQYTGAHPPSSIDFYPRPPRGGRPGHAFLCKNRLRHFYPRPPRGGRRICGKTVDSASKFLPTPSARRATAGLPQSPPLKTNFYPRPPRGGRHRRNGHGAYRCRNFYPRPPRGGRLGPVIAVESLDAISTHALREEGDNRRIEHEVDALLFLPTPSARRATAAVSEEVAKMAISTHALREEGDRRRRCWMMCFRPFLPTPSARRATPSRPTTPYT